MKFSECLPACNAACTQAGRKANFADNNSIWNFHFWKLKYENSIFLETMVLPTMSQSSMKNATPAKKSTLKTFSQCNICYKIVKEIKRKEKWN